MINFERKKVCSKCGGIFEWIFTHGDDGVFIAGQLNQTNKSVKQWSYDKENKKYSFIVECPKCGKRERVEEE